MNLRIAQINLSSASLNGLACMFVIGAEVSGVLEEDGAEVARPTFKVC